MALWITQQQGCCGFLISGLVWRLLPVSQRISKRKWDICMIVFKFSEVEESKIITYAHPWDVWGAMKWYRVPVKVFRKKSNRKYGHISDFVLGWLWVFISLFTDITSLQRKLLDFLLKQMIFVYYIVRWLLWKVNFTVHKIQIIKCKRSVFFSSC